MKKFRFLAVILAIMGLLVIGVPATATTTATFEVSGIEIFAGIDIGNYNFGATFVAKANGINDTDFNGVLSTSANYTPNSPVPDGTNTIFGGSWTLTLTRDGRAVGTVLGRITGGEVTWSGGEGTDYGHITTDLKITGGSGIARGIRGTGTFEGTDNHVSGLFIAGIEVPTITGTLTLDY